MYVACGGPVADHFYIKLLGLSGMHDFILPDPFGEGRDIGAEFCFHLHVMLKGVCDMQKYKEVPLWSSLSMIEC